MKASIFFMAALCATGVYAQGNSDDEDIQGIPADATGGTLQRGVPIGNLPGFARANASGTGNLIYHGGRVLPTSHIYYIWWGSGWPSGDAQPGLEALASGLNGSSFTNDIFPQYMGGPVSPGFVTSLFDTSAPPSRGPNTSTIVSEACKVIGANHKTPDATAVYFVLTSNFPHRVNYCAWHSYGTCNGTTIQVAYMPNTANVAGCDPGNLYNCNGYSQGTRSVGNVLSHEWSEAITDPDLNAWYDSSGSEIGDKCAWQFQSCVALTGSSWQLQMEWSNNVSACVQQ